MSKLDPCACAAWNTVWLLLLTACRIHSNGLDSTKLMDRCPTAIAYSGGGERLLVATGDGTVQVLDARDGTRIQTLGCAPAYVCGITAGPNGDSALCRDPDNVVTGVGSIPHEVLATIRGDRQRAAVGSDAHQVVLINYDGRMLAWSDGWSHCDTWNVPCDHGIVWAAPATKHRLYGILDSHGCVSVLSPAQTDTCRYYLPEGRYVMGAWLHNSPHIVIVSRRGSIHALDCDSGGIVLLGEESVCRPVSMSISSDDRYCAVLAFSGAVLLVPLDPQSRTRPVALDQCAGIAFSPTVPNHLATTTADEVILLDIVRGSTVWKRRM